MINLSHARIVQQCFPGIYFHSLREHAGLALQAN